VAVVLVMVLLVLGTARSGLSSRVCRGTTAVVVVAVKVEMVVVHHIMLEPNLYRRVINHPKEVNRPRPFLPGIVEEIQITR
jgi:hypothetical protein